MVEVIGLEPIRLALPKGRFHGSTADALGAAGLCLDDYNTHSRQYRVCSTRFPQLSAKILQERDISVHVSVGNYDLGVCGVDWVRELKARYPGAGLVEVSPLNYREGAVYLASSAYSELTSVSAITSSQRVIRIVSEYPSMATALAARLRLRRFQVFPIWGAAEAYPPESADLVVMWVRSERDLISQGLVPLQKLLDVEAVLVGNSDSLASKDMSEVLARLTANFRRGELPASVGSESIDAPVDGDTLSKWQSRLIRLALPDGHQKTPAVELLERARLDIPGYSGRTAERRLLAGPDWLAVKVIRPQDMPLQVASGHFDIAVTGQDWLAEHHVAFPGSPVVELADLGFGKVRVVAALSEQIPVNTVEELRGYMNRGGMQSLRVASEYTNIADKYLRDNHIVSYKVMPTWGASEAFLPDDADLLVDNTQTGKTLADNGLKIIEVILRSSACLVANTDSLRDPAKKPLIDVLVSQLVREVQ